MTDGNISTTTLPNGAGNPWTCEGRVSPSGPELLQRLANADTSTVVTICVPPILFGIMSLLFLDEIIFIAKQPMHWRRKTYYAWVLSCYPFLGLMNVIGLFVPRGSGVVSFTSSFFFALVLKKFSQQVIDLYGSKSKMVATLEGYGVFPPWVFPCCFVFCCCRNQTINARRLNILHALTYQVIFVHPTIYFLQTLLVAEGYNRTAQGVLILNLLGYIGTAANFTALYGYVIMSKASREALQQFAIRWKYLCIQLVVACNTIQGFTLGVLQRYDQVPCGFPYPDPQRAFVLHSWILQIELFLLSIGAWWCYRRSEVNCHVILAESDDVKLTNVSTFTDFTSGKYKEKEEKMSSRRSSVTMDGEQSENEKREEGWSNQSFQNENGIV